MTKILLKVALDTIKQTKHIFLKVEIYTSNGWFIIIIIV